MSFAHLGLNTFSVNATYIPFDVHSLVINLNVTDYFLLNAFVSVCLSKTNFIGEDFSKKINTDYFPLKSMTHINLEIPLLNLNLFNGIESPHDHWIKSLSIIFILMSEAHILNKFSLPFVYRIEEGFGCFFWANRR
jgi:integral membrane sensor domain MASE1